MDIIENIIKIRKSKGLTQKVFSDKIDMPQANYARIETKETQLTIDKLEKIAIGLGVSIQEIISWGNDDTNWVEREKRLNKEIKDLTNLLENAELKIELLKTH